MKNQLLRVLVLIGAVFPFVMVGFKLFEEESIITGGFYTAVVVIFFATVYLGLRVRATPLDTTASSDGRETAERS